MITGITDQATKPGPKVVGTHWDEIPRVLLAKVGLDGHDRGVKVVARGLRDAGCHVIYGGIWQDPEVVAQAALDEDADWLGLSLLSGAHLSLVPRVMDALRTVGNQRTRCMIGGIIPDQDVEELQRMGVQSIFGPGTPIQTIVDFLRQPGTKRSDSGSLIDAVDRAERSALGETLSMVQQGRITAQDVASDVIEDSRHSKRSSPRKIAFTGSAGVGKSSLIAKLLPDLVRRGFRVAVLACDPQSPVSGGALLGDRVRMNHGDHRQEQVFIRSLAVPSGQQGIPACLDVMLRVLQRFGFDFVLVESVGVGQGDVAIGALVDQVIVLLQPESGDAIQWEKAGLLEIADMIVIHKSDLPGANRLENELRCHLNLPGCRDVPFIRIGHGVQPGWDELLRCVIG